jgi:hypothetical protein
VKETYMGEHKTNFQAILAQMLPTAFPPGKEMQFQIAAHVYPARNVILAAPEDFRASTEEGKAHEVKKSALGQEPGDEWVPVPNGCKVLELGNPLDPADCELSIELVPIVIDVALPVLTMPGGQRNVRASHGPAFILAKANLAAFRAYHDANFSAPAPAPEEEAKPGLVLVP